MVPRRKTALDNEFGYRVLFEQAVDGALVLDADTGKIVAFNEAVCTGLGYTRREFAKLSLANIGILGPEQDIMGRIAVIVERGSDSFETQHRHKDGTIRDVHISCKAIEIQDTMYLYIIYRDITEWKMIEIQKTELLLRQSQFMQNVSHELRTPLALVMGYADLLVQGLFGVLEEKQYEAIEIILRRARSLRRMVKDILAIIEIEQRPAGVVDDFKPVDVSMLVQQLVKDQQIIAAEQGVSLVCETERRIVILGDAGMIQQSVDNVVQNALKFTKTGGLVDVSVYTDPELSSCVIKVQDTGIGIAQKMLSAIFYRFYQVDGSDSREYGGVGLGLAVAKEIVETHGGRMDAESVLGKGSTFCLYYPLAEVKDG